MPEPVTTAKATAIAGKIAAAAVRPLARFAQQQWDRRDATEIAAADPATIAPELAEAIAVLRRTDDTAIGHIKAGLKAFIADPPAIFREMEAQDWLARGDVQQLLQTATIALIIGEDLAGYEAEARRLYGDTTGEADWYGAPLFEYAIAFMALSLRAKLGFESRLQLAADNARESLTREQIAGLRDQMDKTNQRLDGFDLTSNLPVDVLDAFLLDEVARRDSIRAIVDDEAVPGAVALATRALNGDLRGASLNARSAAFRHAAAMHAREGDPDISDHWLDNAAQLGTNDLAADRARIALARKDPEGAIALLGNAQDKLSNSLRLDALAQRDGEVEAVRYFEDYHSAADVTGFFLSTIAHWYAHQGKIADGEVLLAAATNEQLEENRTLKFVRLRFRLALCAPADQQLEIITAYSMLPQPGSLRDDVDGIRLKELARVDAFSLLEELRGRVSEGFTGLIEMTAQYLALISGDPEIVKVAREQIGRYLADPEKRVIFAPLSMPFEIEFDTQALAAQLGQLSRLGKWDDTQLRAAFELAVCSRDPREISDFIDRYRERLAQIIGARQAIGVQLEFLARNGRASEIPDKIEAAADLLSATDRQFLQAVVQDILGQGSPEPHLERFAETGSEQDLQFAIQALLDAKDSRLPDYAQQLWSRRRRIEDAVAAANALAWFGRDFELQAFLTDLADTVAMSPELEAHLAWMRYREGRLGEADELVSRLRATDPDHVSLRQLQINIAIEWGEWHNLGDLFKEDLARADTRSAEQLLQSAALATAAGNPDGRALLEAAVSKGGEDPRVYLSAFQLALRRGEDLEERTANWLNKAAELSGPDGPVQAGPVRDMIRMRDEHRERFAKLDRMIMSGEVTVALAARPLGTTLTSLILHNIPANAALNDARDRLSLPLYAGNRARSDIAPARSLAIEPTALLVLHNLGILGLVFDTYDKIILPAGTLPSLFNDLHDGDRAQPSRAERANEVQKLVALKQLTVVEADGLADDAIERSFALAEANGGRVVHIPPLYVPGSFNEEIRDASPFLSRLVSIAGIIEGLHVRGEIGSDEADQARRFFSTRQKWDEERSIAFDGPLILDAVSLHYLIDTGLIAALRRLGIELLISSDVVASANDEIHEHAQIAGLKGEIDKLRSVINGALRAGKAVISPALRNQAPVHHDDDDEVGLDGGIEPLSAILNDSAEADWLIADDRFVNQHLHFNDNQGRSNGVATSLDIIDSLHARGAIDAPRRDRLIQTLRSSALGLIPVRTDEIVAAASQGDWSHGPSRALRAIRDSILLPVLRDSILLPLECFWVEQTIFNLAIAIRQVFRTLPVEDAGRSADFIYSMIPDIRSLPAIGPAAESALWANSIAAGWLALLSVPVDLNGERLDAYHLWFDKTPWQRMRGRDGDLVKDVKSRLKEMILAHRNRLSSPGDTKAPPPQAVALWLVEHVPSSLRDELEADEEIRNAIGQSLCIPIDGRNVDQVALNSFFRSLLEGQEVALIDIDGELVANGGVVNEDGSISIECADQRFRFEQTGFFSSDGAIRRSALQAMLASHTMASSRETHWYERIEAGPLDVMEFLSFLGDLRNTGEHWLQATTEAMADQDYEFQQLAQLSENHFLSFAETCAAPASLDEMIEELAKRRRSGLNPITAAVASAPLSIAPTFAIEEFTGPLDSASAAKLAHMLIDMGDPFSLLSAFEIVCQHVGDPECRTLGDSLMDMFWGEMGDAPIRCEDFCTAVVIAMVVIRWQGPLRDWPLAGRRLAVFGHAGLICRAFRHFEIKRPELLEEVQGCFGQQFKLAGLTEALENGGWSASWLVPKVIEGYLLRRFDEKLDLVPEADRPQIWVDRLRARVDSFKGAMLSFLHLPGPLDPFSASGLKRPIMSVPDVDALVAALQGPATGKSADLIMQTSMSFLPPDCDMEPLVNAIVEQARTVNEDIQGGFHRVAMHLAAAWKLPALAEGLVESLPREKLSTLGLIEQALCLVAAQPDLDKRMELLASQLMLRARQQSNSQNRHNFYQGLQLLLNGEPALAQHLHRVLASAALGL